MKGREMSTLDVGQSAVNKPKEALERKSETMVVQIWLPIPGDVEIERYPILTKNIQVRRTTTRINVHETPENAP